MKNFNYIVFFKKPSFGSNFGLWEVLELKMPSRCQTKGQRDKETK